MTRYVGRRRSPHRVRPVDEARIPAQHEADHRRHLADGRSPAEATALASVDAGDRLTAWLAAR